MNKNMAPKLSSLPCFEAFWVIFCPGVCSYFCLACGGGGHPRISERGLQWRLPCKGFCHWPGSWKKGYQGPLQSNNKGTRSNPPLPKTKKAKWSLESSAHSEFRANSERIPGESRVSIPNPLITFSFFATNLLGWLATKTH